jgi:hypothetical protein
MRASTIDADYNFLKRVDNAKTEGRTETKKLDHGRSRTVRRKADEARRKRWMREVAGRGVVMKELPRWMERRTRNRSRFMKEYGPPSVVTDSRDEVLEWTVEWIIDVDGETKTIFDDR